MELSDILEKQLKISNAGSKVEKITLGGMLVYQEYKKWLSYSPVQSKIELDNISLSHSVVLTTEEKVILQNCNEELEIVSLLDKKEDNNTTVEEDKKIVEYIKSHPIEVIMQEKLTAEQLEAAKEFMKAQYVLSEADLHQYVAYYQKPENYKTITIEHAYALHELSKISAERSIHSLETQIKSQTDENRRVLEKSIKNASQYFV